MMNRREMLVRTAAAPIAASFPALATAAEAKDLTLSQLELFLVPVNRRGAWLLVRLTTKSGITGIGDASHGGQDPKKIALIRSFYERINNRSAADVEYLRKITLADVLSGGTPAAISMSGLEQAMWDIQGKAAGVPCYDLFGGLLQSRIRNYANINRSTETRDPAGFAAMAERAVKAGFTAIKLAPFDDMPGDLTKDDVIGNYTKLGIARAEGVRNAIGPKLDLLIDAHSHFDLRRGLELAKRMEHLNLFWLEEVTPAKPPTILAEINKAAKMPTAGGEAIYGVRGFVPYLNAGAVDIAMPDVKYCGGMLELKKIAAFCEAVDVPVAPHGPASPIGNLAAAHVCATIPNYHILEFSFGEVDWRADVVEPAEKLVGGHIELGRRPGLGVTLNEKLVGKHRVPA
jgi:galactonate dehydratase